MDSIDSKAINTIRFLAVDAVEEANSGHPGLPMGAAAMVHALFSAVMKHCPSNPDWPDRDRFILSAGHGSMLLYALLHLYGYGLTIEDLKNFRQWGSRTPGHPEYGHTPGVETTTGPLGQGFANAVGMAIAERRLAAEFNRPGFEVVDHYTYVLSGDGCMMEGITSEAASLAGHLGLGKLICLYDDNSITIDGATDITFTEDTGKRFEAYGWQVLQVENGNDPQAVIAALRGAKNESAKPSLVMVKTVIGYGAPNRQGTAAAHGAPLGAEEALLAKSNLNWPQEPKFFVPPEVREHFSALSAELYEKKIEWDRLFAGYRLEHPDLAGRWDAWFSRELPPSLENDERLIQRDMDKVATRVSSGQIMQVLAEHLPNMIGGSADLNASTKTELKGRGDFQAGSPGGSNIHFGVREHAMGAILSGLSLHGGMRPYGSTFLVFYDYMKPAVRLAALMGQPVVFIYTHDSVAVGEDGPTHQPVEHLVALRCIPNLAVFRPADRVECAAAWIEILKRNEGPSALLLTRQNLPPLNGRLEMARRGAYIICREQGEELDLIIIASGSELHLALQAKNCLAGKGYAVRVVSMVCRELFLAQDRSYIDSVLPPAAEKRLVVEAALPGGWDGLVGPEGLVLGIDRFGASAPGSLVMEKLGISLEAVNAAAERLIGADPAK